MKGSGCMHPLSSEVVKVCLPGGQIKVSMSPGRVSKKEKKTQAFLLHQQAVLFLYSSLEEAYTHD
eukprot:scaffold266509_cov14-Tisochrysis_lutea.AAC.1